MRQKTLRLTVAPVEGESVNEFRFRAGELNARVKGEARGHVEPQKLLCDLLKRQARAAMADVTRCQPDTIAAHLARMEAVCDVAEHLIRHDLAATPESRLSGRQLAYPTTLADFIACMELTRRNHRCPEFVNPIEDKQAEILRKLETIAFFVSQNQNTNTINTEEN